MSNMDVVSDCRATSPEPRKINFGLAEGKWKTGNLNIKTHLTTNNIHMRRHFLVLCGS